MRAYFVVLLDVRITTVPLRVVHDVVWHRIRTSFSLVSGGGGGGGGNFLLPPSPILSTLHPFLILSWPSSALSSSSTLPSTPLFFPFRLLFLILSFSLHSTSLFFRFRLLSLILSSSLQSTLLPLPSPVRHPLIFPLLHFTLPPLPSPVPHPQYTERLTVDCANEMDLNKKLFQ